MLAGFKASYSGYPPLFRHHEAYVIVIKLNRYLALLFLRRLTLSIRIIGSNYGFFIPLAALSKGFGFPHLFASSPHLPTIVNSICVTEGPPRVEVFMTT